TQPHRPRRPGARPPRFCCFRRCWAASPAPLWYLRRVAFGFAFRVTRRRPSASPVLRRAMPARMVELLASLQLASCIGSRPQLARRTTDDDAGARPPISVDPRVKDAAVELGAIDPHALVGVDPSRGPWSGGQARIVRGNGFGTGLRVWFGANEVA